MHDSVRGTARGKLILCGEHAVVHGQPAIAFAVHLTTTVTASPTPGPTRVAGIRDERVQQAAQTVFGPHGAEVSIHSEVPIGRGMGSSAALAVAMVRADAALRDEELTGDDVFARAVSVERIFHGNPSGLDVAISVRQGVIRFHREEDPPFTDLPAPTSWQTVALDSGSQGNTAALVAGVTARRPGIDPVLQRIGDLTRRVQDVLDDADQLGPLLTENHNLLREIGVSTPDLDNLVELALRAGALGAKLAGAGGGGVVLALTTDPASLVDAANRHGVRSWVCRPAPPR